MQDLITTAAAAKLLGVSQRTVEDLISAGKLEKVKVTDRLFVVYKADVEALAKERGETKRRGWPAGKERKPREPP